MMAHMHRVHTNEAERSTVSVVAGDANSVNRRKLNAQTMKDGGTHAMSAHIERFSNVEQHMKS